MRDLKKASAIIESVVNAVDLPVSLKARLGWDDYTKNAKELGQLAEKCGVQLFTIHARTRNQFYKGFADWNAILEVKRAVTIPVIVNGDIVDIRSASEALKLSETDGLMIGRGVIGKPWLISQISAYLNKKPQPPSPNGLRLIELIVGHYDEILTFYGESLGVRIARKHLKRYLDIFGLSTKLSTDFLKENSSKEVIRKLFEIPERLNQ